MEKGLLLSWLAFLPPGCEYSCDAYRYNSCCPIKGKKKNKLNIVRILEIKKSLQKYTEQPLDHQSLIFCFLIDYKIIIILGLFLFFRLNAF